MFFSYSFQGLESYSMFLGTSLDVKSFPTTAYEPICCTQISSLQSTAKQTVPFSFCMECRIVNSRLWNSILRASSPIPISRAALAWLPQMERTSHEPQPQCELSPVSLSIFTLAPDLSFEESSGSSPLATETGYVTRRKLWLQSVLTTYLLTLRHLNVKL